MKTVCEKPFPADTGTEQRARQRTLWKLYRRRQNRHAIESELVQQYLPLVKSVVGRMAMTLSSEADLEDMTSAALLGLIMAVRNFDPDNGASFETYARIRIRGAVLDELRRMDWVPRSVHEKTRMVDAAMQRLEQALGRTPTEAEMARALKVSPAEYQDLIEEIKPVSFVCLDALSNDDGEDNSTPYESIPDPSQPNPREETAKREFIEMIFHRMRQLPAGQHRVISLYYFEELRLREIAKSVGVTESRICQVHSQAIASIKNSIRKLDPALLPA